MSLRILMLLENAGYPDDTRVVLEAETLQEAGHQVTVICPGPFRSRRTEVINGVRVYRYQQLPEMGGLAGYVIEWGYSLTVTWLISLYVLLRRGVDVVHSHAPPDLYMVIGRFYKLLGKKYVFDHHDLSPELYQAKKGGGGSKMVDGCLRWLERSACRAANRLIATNETQRQIQIDRGGADPANCYVVRNGPHLRFLEPYEPLEEFASTSNVIFGYVGMMGVQDGVDYLLKMLHTLRTQHDRHDFHCLILGEGPAVNMLKELCAELDLDGHVTFMGFVRGERLLRAIATFDIAVTPDPSNEYNDSCTTIKTMEYMAMGKPTVAFDLPENRFTAGDAALYAQCNEIEHLALQAAKLMDNAALRQRLGARGRQRIEDRLLWVHQAKNLLALYDSFAPAEVTRPVASTVKERDEPIRETVRSGSE